MRVKCGCSCLLTGSTPYSITTLLVDQSSIDLANIDHNTALSVAIECKRFHIIPLLVQVREFKKNVKFIIIYYFLIYVKGK